MRPPIHYVRTPDGCAIAYTVSGTGPPLVYLQPYSHQEIDSHHPVIGPWRERIDRHHTVVRLDVRGFGLSERDSERVSLEGQAMDVATVVDRLGVERCAMVGISGQGLVAIIYAAAHPEQVSSLVLWGTTAVYRDSRSVTTLALSDLDPELQMDAHARWLAGDVAEEVSNWSAYARAGTDPAALRAYLLALRDADVDPQIGQVRAPCTLIHPRLHKPLTMSASRDLASRLPECEFAMAEGRIYPHLGPDQEANARVIEHFLGYEREQESPSAGLPLPAAPPGTLHTILFTDLESSTSLTQRLGDDRAQELVRGHDRVVRAALQQFGGREVKHTGDGIMADFPSAVAGVRAALRIRDELGAGEVRARVALNAGEPIEEGGDLFGTSVQLAARLCGYAEPGQVLVANVVRELCAGKGFRFAPLGLIELKGFNEPTAAYTVVEES